MRKLGFAVILFVIRRSVAYLLDFLILCLLLFVAGNLAIAWYEAETDHLLILPYPEHEQAPPTTRGGGSSTSAQRDPFADLMDTKLKVVDVESRVKAAEATIKTLEYDVKQADRQRQERWEQNENRFARIETNMENLTWWHRAVSAAVLGQIIGFVWLKMRERNGKGGPRR